MKKCSLILATLICSFNLFAQGFKLPAYYSQRELKAPVAVKEQLELMRREITAKNLKYQVGYTSVSDVPIEKLRGLRLPAPDAGKKISETIRPDMTSSGKQASHLDRLSKETLNPYIYGNPKMKKLDLREGGFITPVHDQKQFWNVCWAFAAMDAYESSYKILTKKTIDVSEQYVVDCSGVSDWVSGGYMHEVFGWMVSSRKNLASEAAVPLVGPPTRCPGVSPATDYYASDWGFVEPYLNSGLVPPADKLKEAICAHGAISAGVIIDQYFMAYIDGPFSSFKTDDPKVSMNGKVGTGIVIIGWDDSIECWLIKNSWGTDWGSECGYGSERGYMWIKYNSNRIGYYAAWVQASQTGLK